MWKMVFPVPDRYTLFAGMKHAMKQFCVYVIDKHTLLAGVKGTLGNGTVSKYSQHTLFFLLYLEQDEAGFALL